MAADSKVLARFLLDPEAFVEEWLIPTMHSTWPADLEQEWAGAVTRFRPRWVAKFQEVFAGARETPRGKEILSAVRADASSVGAFHKSTKRWQAVDHTTAATLARVEGNIPLAEAHEAMARGDEEYADRRLRYHLSTLAVPDSPDVPRTRDPESEALADMVAGFTRTAPMEAPAVLPTGWKFVGTSRSGRHIVHEFAREDGPVVQVLRSGPFWSVRRLNVKEEPSEVIPDGMILASKKGSLQTAMDRAVAEMKRLGRVSPPAAVGGTLFEQAAHAAGEMAARPSAALTEQEREALRRAADGLKNAAAAEGPAVAATKMVLAPSAGLPDGVTNAGASIAWAAAFGHALTPGYHNGPALEWRASPETPSYADDLRHKLMASQAWGRGDLHHFRVKRMSPFLVIEYAPNQQAKKGPAGGTKGDATPRMQDASDVVAQHVYGGGITPDYVNTLRAEERVSGPASGTAPHAPAEPSTTVPHPPEKVRVQVPSVPRHTVDAAVLAADYKAQGHTHPSTAYGQFVRDRQLKPEMDAKAFGRVFNAVQAQALKPEHETVAFLPTHWDSVLNLRVQVVPKPQRFDIVWETGMTGGEPGTVLPDRYQPLPTAVPEGTPQARGPSSWMHSVLGPIRVEQGAEGSKGGWNVIHHGGNWYGWEGTRWSRHRPPPDELLQAVREQGWGDLFKVGAAGTERKAYAERREEEKARAERRQERYNNAAERQAAESARRFEGVRRIADNIPLGQPILVGHHSERRARKDAERIFTGMGKAIEADKLAQAYRGTADASEAHQERKERPDVTRRRLERLEAELRGVERSLAGQDSRSGYSPAAGDWKDRLERSRADLVDQIAYWKAHLVKAQEAGFKAWGPEDFKKGDRVYSPLWGAGTVVRVNPKGLSVKLDKHPIYGSGEDVRAENIPYHKLSQSTKEQT